MSRWNTVTAVGLWLDFAGTDASSEIDIILDPSCPSWSRAVCFKPSGSVSSADGTFKKVVTEKFPAAAFFLALSLRGNRVLLNEDLCSNLPSILPSFPPSRQIYLPLRQPRPPYLSQQPFLLAWHLCLCSAVIVDLYFDSMHLRILLMCVFYLCVRAHCLLYVCISLPVCVCVANRSYWLVVKPRSLRVFMSGEAEQLGGIFPSLKQNDSLDSLSLCSDSLCWAKRHVSQSS